MTIFICRFAAVIGTMLMADVKMKKCGKNYGDQAIYSGTIKTCRNFLRIHDEKSTIDAEKLTSSNISL